VKPVKIKDLATTVALFPNPATDKASLKISGNFDNQEAYISVTNVKGREISYRKILLVTGHNSIEIPIQPSWNSGIYFIKVMIGRDKATRQLIVRKT
jgi:methionine-rich copper-binding protein CopC